MSAATKLQLLFWSYLSRPASDRAIYRSIAKGQLTRFIEFGVGDARRALRMIAIAMRHSPADSIVYTGIDLFETRDGGRGLPLKQAHKQLRATGIRPHLIPGSPHEALVRSANSIRPGELVIISRDQDAESLAQAWYFLPRILAAGATVLQEEVHGSKTVLRTVTPLEIARLSAPPARQRRAA